MKTTQQDDPYYTSTRDGRRVHVCQMPGHSRYWLNSGAALWVCERCHPHPYGYFQGSPVGDVALASVGEIVEAAKRRPLARRHLRSVVRGWRNADD